MFGNMMDQLQQMKQKVEETKSRLDNMTVTGTSPGGKVNVEVTGNRKIKSIQVTDNFQEMEKEELEDLLILALNDGLNKADQLNEKEMQGAAMGLLPGMGI